MAPSREGGLAVGLDLGPLVGLERVLEGELVQAELGLELAQVGLAGRLDADPDEVAGLGRPGAALRHGDVGHPAAGAVGGGGDHPAHRLLPSWPCRHQECHPRCSAVEADGRQGQSVLSCIPRRLRRGSFIGFNF
jgi:hypothetical protein